MPPKTSTAAGAAITAGTTYKRKGRDKNLIFAASKERKLKECCPNLEPGNA
jgi:hypothetical protein